jgi:hypothetical protein
MAKIYIHCRKNYKTAFEAGRMFERKFQQVVCVNAPKGATGKLHTFSKQLIKDLDKCKIKK